VLGIRIRATAFGDFAGVIIELIDKRAHVGSVGGEGGRERV
jgi:hypothetical protein